MALPVPQRPVPSAPRQLLWCPPITNSGPGQGYVWWWPGGGILEGSALTGALKSEDELEERDEHSLEGSLQGSWAQPEAWAPGQQEGTSQHFGSPLLPTSALSPCTGPGTAAGSAAPSELSQAPALEQSWGQAKGSRLRWKRNFRTDTSCRGRPGGSGRKGRSG